jgi:hypothetical protein
MQTPVGTVMSRLFRGRKLLAGALRDFAIAEGYVKSAEERGKGKALAGPAPDVRSDGDEDGQRDETIDLGKYRAARSAREGSQS